MTEELYIGGYIIQRIEDTDKFWITNDDGEGMETTEAALTAMIHKFWQENF